MSTWFEFGIQANLLLQTVDWIEAPMRFFTSLGNRQFFIFVLPVLYWCIDAGLGIRVGFILLLGNGLNEIAKMALQGPRPYWVSTQVKALEAQATFGIPSGHAQVATGVWGTMAAAIRRRWARIAAVLLILSISISRLYLGVHFPGDVLLGWLLGGITLWIFLSQWGRLAGWVSQRTLSQQLLLSAVLPAVMLLASGSLVDALRGYSLPEAWLANARRAGEPFPAPLSMEGTVSAAGCLLGLSFGLAIIGRQGGYRPSGPVWVRLICFVLGLIGVLAVYLGFGAASPDDGTLLAASLRFLRDALLGLWVSLGAPLAFWRLGLSQRSAVGLSGVG